MRLRLAFVLPLCLASVLAVSARASAPLPRLDLRGDPAVVRGFNFQPHEAVRLVLVAHGSFSRRLLASGTGTFRAVFRSASAAGCGVFSVRANGSRGSGAYLRRHVGCPVETTP